MDEFPTDNGAKSSNLSRESNVNNRSDEINLLLLFRVLLDRKISLVLFTSIFALASVYYALNLENEYRASATLVPVASKGGAVSRLASQFGGLASLAGISLGSSGSIDKSVTAIEVMQSWEFIDRLIKKHRLEVEVFAATGWSKSTNTLLINPELYDASKKEWVRSNYLGSGVSDAPSSWELYVSMSERLSVVHDSKTGLIKVSAKHYSPAVAKKWVDLLVLEINSYVKSQDRKEALDSISYLKSQIENTDISEMRTIFYELIEEQTKTLMLADVNKEYVFKTIAAAKEPEQRIRPKRSLIVVMGTFFGFLLTSLYVLFKYYPRNSSI